MYRNAWATEWHFQEDDRFALTSLNNLSSERKNRRSDESVAIILLDRIDRCVCHTNRQEIPGCRCFEIAPSASHYHSMCCRFSSGRVHRSRSQSRFYTQCRSHCKRLEGMRSTGDIPVDGSLLACPLPWVSDSRCISLYASASKRWMASTVSSAKHLLDWVPHRSRTSFRFKRSGVPRHSYEASGLERVRTA